LQPLYHIEKLLHLGLQLDDLLGSGVGRKGSGQNYSQDQ
jgi:hypothetical protein